MKGLRDEKKGAHSMWGPVGGDVIVVGNDDLGSRSRADGMRTFMHASCVVVRRTFESNGAVKMSNNNELDTLFR